MRTSLAASVESIGTISSTRSNGGRGINGRIEGTTITSFAADYDYVDSDDRPALEEIDGEIDNGVEGPLHVDIPELTCFQIGAFLAEGSPGEILLLPPASTASSSSAAKRSNGCRGEAGVVRMVSRGLVVDTSLHHPQSPLRPGLESITSVNSTYHMVNFSVPKDAQLQFHTHMIDIDVGINTEDQEDCDIASLSSLSDSVFSDCGVPLVVRNI